MKMKGFSSATGISDRTIRYYIDDGLFIPEKYSENYDGRKSYDFTDNDVKRLKQIALLRKYDFSAKDIKALKNESCDIAEILSKRIEEAKDSADTQNENIKAMEFALNNCPKNFDELCERLSNPVVEQSPIPNIDEESAYKPMYRKSKKLNKVFIVLIAVVSTIAILMGLYFGFIWLMVGMPTPAECSFEPTEVSCEYLIDYKDNQYFEDFVSCFKERYRLSNKEVEKIYDNAEDYVEVTIIGDLQNYNDFNINRVNPKKVYIPGVHQKEYRVENINKEDYYYTYYFYEETIYGYEIHLLMKKDLYEELDSKGNLKPEVIMVEMSCYKFTDPQYEKIMIQEWESSFNDFEIKDGKVYFYCTLSVFNATTNEQSFTITADFTQDQISGLIEEQTLIAYNQNDLTTDKFYLDPGKEKVIKVCFIGTAAGKTTEKKNRLLPTMTFNTTSIRGKSSKDVQLDKDYNEIIDNISDILREYPRDYSAFPNLGESVAEKTGCEAFNGDNGSGRYIYSFQYDSHLWFEVYDMPFSYAVFYIEDEEYKVVDFDENDFVP